MNVKPFLSIGLIVVIFIIIYLRGKLLQITWKSISFAVKQKRQIMKSVYQLSKGDIDGIYVKFESGKVIDITNLEEIQKFKNSLSHAKICRIKNRGVSEKLQFEVNTNEGEIKYDVFISNSEKTDIFLELISGYKYAIRLPDLKHWLNENIRW